MPRPTFRPLPAVRTQIPERPTLQGPAFEPWERLMLLSRAVEECAPEDAHEVLILFASASHTVVRQMAGNKTRAEAYAAVERCRARAEELRRGRAA